MSSLELVDSLDKMEEGFNSILNIMSIDRNCNKLNLVNDLGIVLVWTVYTDNLVRER